MARSRSRAFRVRRDATLAIIAPVSQPELPVALGQFERADWQDGQLRKLTVLAKDADRIDSLAPLWTDPAIASLETLVVRFKTKRGANAMKKLAGVLPSGLRTLQLGMLDEPYVEDIGGVALIAIATPLLASLPSLEKLSLQGPLGYADLATIDDLMAGKLRSLAHPTLVELELLDLAGEMWTHAMTLSPAALPQLIHLRFGAKFPVGIGSDELCRSLARLGWLAQLDSLALSGGALTEAGLEALVQSMHGRKLAVLDVSGLPVRAAFRGPLEAICDQLVGFVASDAREVGRADELVEHANKPEWGRGRVVRRFDDKIEIDFPAAGKKVFKADAPFLRSV